MKNFETDDFRAFYYYIFNLNMRVVGKEKDIDYEVAKFFLNELFSKKYKIVSVLLEFIGSDPIKYKIKQDTWNNILDFLLQIGDAFPKGYSTLDSWPTLLDEFYLWYCEKNGIKIEEPEFEP